MSAVQAQKKPGGAGVKLFQAILVVNRDPGGTPVTLPGTGVLVLLLLTLR